MIFSSLGFLVLAVFFMNREAHVPNVAADIGGAVNEEKEFHQPIDIVWKGRITSVMSGGSCIGLEGQFDNYSKFIACLTDANSRELFKYSGEVTVTGKWLGITCAYKNTIFGECIPEVEIGEIKAARN